MFKALFGFSKGKKNIFVRRIQYVLIEQMRIDINHDTNRYFLKLYPWDEIISNYFYNKRTPEHCAIALALIYLRSLLENGGGKEHREAKLLKPNIQILIDKFKNNGQLPWELIPRIDTELDDLSVTYKI
ncbi:MAG: hypothetical protein HOE89_02180 [Gammaproteobacteria bacterium]|jgi:hypothetical protein|nr:hypothetical protein [Gammaproteobacteria bacterium]MBT5744359.1 hypothetical protein [Gammaproteobacteria bacterium]